MNPVYIFFSKTPTEPSPAFIEKVLNGLFEFYQQEGGTASFTPEQVNSIAQNVSANLIPGEPPLMPLENHPQVPERWAQRHQQSISCADDIIDRIMRSNASQQFYTILQEDWNGFERGIAVASRTEEWKGQTLQLYFLFPNTLISEEGKMGQGLPRFPFDQAAKNDAVKKEAASILSAPFDSLVI